jgi:hypothetical protein
MEKGKKERKKEWSSQRKKKVVKRPADKVVKRPADKVVKRPADKVSSTDMNLRHEACGERHAFHCFHISSNIIHILSN